MPCYGPIQAFRPKRFLNTGEPNPDQSLVFKKQDAETGVAITIPCGQCMGCRLEYARQWAIRCMHEKRLHNRSSFLTLTYRDADLPPDGTLEPEELKLFMYRLRDKFGPGIRFFACGEYGDKTNRPHYHVLLLSHDFDDKKPWKQGSQGHMLYRSETLSKLWKQGDNYIGDVTYQSAAYVTRYILKKVTGKKSDHYAGRHPEFIRMSRRPGIATGYVTKYIDELLAHDQIIIDGKTAEMPRFYKQKIKEILLQQPSQGLHNKHEQLQLKRRGRLKKLTSKQDNTQKRLRVREIVQLAKLKQKSRTL
ncbi:replication initiator protein [Blackfly microvirus SF02]|uniref:Replication initiator protein n=1 Tax=Blackfly microvirus SF02 TaxID=2576452 RepID=A0A4P8PKI7_9VIRU|nr:replication initiator protein [Blackfly microvirus SF02]